MTNDKTPSLDPDLGEKLMSYNLVTNMEFFRDRYNSELERRDRLNAYLTFPTGLFVAFGGVLAYYLRLVPGLHLKLPDVMFAVTIFFLFLSIVVAARHFVKAVGGYTYAYLPTSQSIAEYVVELVTHYDAQGPDLRHGLFINQDVRERFLLPYYVQASTINDHNNTARSKCLHRTTRALVFSLLFVGLSVPAYVYYNWSLKKESSKKVEQSIDIKETEMPESDEEVQPDQKEQEEPDQPTGEPESPKPEPPPLRLIKEGRDEPPASTKGQPKNGEN